MVSDGSVTGSQMVSAEVRVRVSQTVRDRVSEVAGWLVNFQGPADRARAWTHVGAPATRGIPWPPAHVPWPCNFLSKTISLGLWPRIPGSDPPPPPGPEHCLEALSHKTLETNPMEHGGSCQEIHGCDAMTCTDPSSLPR